MHTTSDGVGRTQVLPPATLLCADWAKDPQKRFAWLGDPARGTLQPLTRAPLSLAALLSQARRGPGPVLVALDLVLGIPRPFLSAWRTAAPEAALPDFPAWLAHAGDRALFEPVTRPEAWQLRQPFHAIPAGVGMRRAYDTAAGFPLSRAVDRRFGGKPPFCVRGIPGSVGAGTLACWQELAPLLREAPAVAPSLWPFDGPLASLLQQGGAVVLAECYPALAYGVALAETLPGQRVLVAKTRRADREAALARVQALPWFAEAGLRIDGLACAEASEDAFDALFQGLALLRALYEGLPLDTPQRDDPEAEGGVLLDGLVAEGPARRFVAG